jgi:hypothetical protein
MNRPQKSIKTKMPAIGAVVELELPSGRKGYARILANPLMAFYAVQSSEPMDLGQILRQPIAFKVWVMNSAITSGRWRVVGSAPVEAELEVSPWFFKQDPISNSLTLYRSGVERPATMEDCLGLECAAAWSAEHVESRLQDHLDGKPNKWVEALKIK